MKFVITIVTIIVLIFVSLILMFWSETITDDLIKKYDNYEDCDDISTMYAPEELATTSAD
jgi:hypothetical protein